MKKRAISLFLALVVICCCFKPSAYAVQRASEYLSSYSTDVIAMSGGEIAIDFMVRGMRVMDRIGAQNITVFAENGGSWMPVASYNSNDDGMNRSNAVSFGNTLYVSGTAGTYYRVVITIFAEDSSGSDARTRIHYVTARS